MERRGKRSSNLVRHTCLLVVVDVSLTESRGIWCISCTSCAEGHTSGGRTQRKLQTDHTPACSEEKEGGGGGEWKVSQTR